MSKPEPFFDSCDDFERSLLRSVRTDAPPAGAALKTIAALGIDPTMVAAIKATEAATATVLGVRAISIAAVLKGLGVGVLVGIVVLAMTGQLSQPQRPRAVPTITPGGHHRVGAPTESPPARPSDSATEPALAPPDRKNQEPKPTADTQAIPARRQAMNVAASATNQSPTAPLTRPPAVATFAVVPSASNASTGESATSIAEQVQLIDRARSTLKAGQPSETVTLVDTYAQRWPNGALSIEAIILRIEAELGLHDRSAAERDARSVIASRPGSRYETRVRALFSPPLAE